MRKSAAPSQRAGSSGASSRPRMVPIVPTKTLEGSSATSELVAKESSSGATTKESSIPLPLKSPLASRSSSYKPSQFRSPLLSTAGSSSSPITPIPASSPISSNKREAEPSSQVNKRPKVSPATLHISATTTATSRTPLKSIASTIPTSSNEICYNVLWRKKTGKKHKTWDGDGILVVTGTSGSLKDMDGKDLGKATKMAASNLKPGDELSFGGKDIEISSLMDLELYRSGRCFLSGAVTTVSEHKMPMTTKFKAHAGLVDPGAASSRPQPRHSPDAPHAILLPRPPVTHPRVVRGGGSKRPPGDAGLVDVVVDPILGQHLRPHQRVGVQFLYECVMQMKDITGQGAILADEMGLGKTLQTITLLWTLLKQSPYYGEESSVVKRALVVCPASLITNWCKEFKKWLGDERLKVFAVDSKSALTDFTLGRVYPVMLRMVQDELKNANFDIIICDEGHRLKTANIKTAQAIRSLSTKKRIILSGTPLQNHLSEYYSMIDFVNPGLFESYSSFKKVFEDPIVKSRQPDCIPVDAALGLERSQELKDDPEIEGLYSGVKETIMQSGYDLMDSAIGGKLGFVDSFLRVLKRNTSEKVVLVSNFTQTLDILEAICVKSQYGLYRLDGSTPIAKRQEYVDKFNAPTCQKFVFLLSAKSGGAGLNLIGASRLIMFDIDWNPSVDQQAMARIHRDGQPRPVFIYRLLSSGTIEEKMYQRQLTKIGLSDALMDGKSDEKLNKFSMAELRDLFTFHEDEPCLTHTLLECDCSSSRSTKARSTKLGGGNGILNAQSKSVAKKELQEWKHVDVVAELERHDRDEEGVTTLPSEDKILWRTICGEGRSEVEDAPGSPGQDEQGVAEVGFVFIKSSKVE
ncbi:helicase [Podila verticillata]|nr:helicase [Podila verticillata]